MSLSKLFLAALTVAFLASSTFAQEDRRLIWNNGGGDNLFTTGSNWGAFDGGIEDDTVPGTVPPAGGPSNAIIQNGDTVVHNTAYTAANPFDVLIVRFGSQMDVSADLNLHSTTDLLVAQIAGNIDVFNHSAGTVTADVATIGAGEGFYNLSGTAQLDVNAINLTGAATLSVQGDMSNIDTTSFAIGSDATLEFVLGSSGTDAIDVAGTFSPDGGSLVIDGSAYTGPTTAGTTITLVNYSTEASQFDAANVTINGLTGATVEADGSTTFILFSAVPEPSSATLIALGFSAFVFRRRR